MDMEKNNDNFNFFDEENKQPPAPAPVQKSKKITLNKLIALFMVLIIFGAGFGIGWMGHYYSLDEEIRTFLWALGVSERNYYQEIDRAELYEKLYDVLNLDPYSQLFTPDEYNEYNLEGEGQNMGVGISLSQAKDSTEPPRFFLVVENSPASRAGIRKGMYLLGFGESEGSLRAGTPSEIVEFIGKQSGEFILRCGFEADGSDAKNYLLKRESYQAAFVHYRDSQSSFRFRGEDVLMLTETYEPLEGLDEKTAYLRLDEFSGYAAKEFEACLSLMKARGREHLILDLRTDGGGYLNILCEIASHLMRNAKGNSPVVAKAIYRDRRQITYPATGNDFYDYFNENSHVYVLADENTASASECLIGALVDYGTTSLSEIYLRENVDGVAKSYGKGIMQSHFASASGAAMKLTVAEIVWPVTGRSIHGIGVTPTYPEAGAVGIPADLIWGNTDPMLEEVISRVCR